MDNSVASGEAFESLSFDGKSTVFDNQFIMKCKYSWGQGDEFKEVITKHNSGATHIGVPLEILSNPPVDVKPTRMSNINSIGIDGVASRVRQYKNWKFECRWYRNCDKCN